MELSRVPSREVGAGGVDRGVFCLEVLVETRGQLQPRDQIKPTTCFCTACELKIVFNILNVSISSYIIGLILPLGPQSRKYLLSDL